MSVQPDNASYHTSVMLNEVVSILKPEPGKIFVDGTLGAGGHALAIAQHLRPGGRLIGIDRDPEAIAEAGKNLVAYSDIVTIVKSRFDSLAGVLDTLDISHVDGVLFDLGVSSHQLDATYRGFSFKDPDAPLDMRMDQSSDGVLAADILNNLSERELTELIRNNSDEEN
jgi:16S rRNA (cytosine1402-N4)-methyltransferase